MRKKYNIDTVDFFLRYKNEDGYYQFKFNYFFDKFEQAIFKTLRIANNPLVTKFYNANDLINHFKELCDPIYDNDRDNVNNEYTFILMCFWLYKNNYTIDGFEHVLEAPQDLYEFANRDIRSRLRELGKVQEDGTIAWAERRAFIKGLVIYRKSSTKLSTKSMEIINEVNIHGRDYIDMDKLSKLSVIYMAIENILKVGKKYIDIDYGDIFFNLITKEDIQKFKNEIQCIRHGSKDNVEKKNSLSDERQSFLVNYGETIVEAISHLENKN